MVQVVEDKIEPGENKSNEFLERKTTNQKLQSDYE